MAGGLWPDRTADKFDSIMQQYRGSPPAQSATTSQPSGISPIIQDMQTAPFKLDVLSIVVAEIIFAAIVLILRYVVKRMEK